MLDVARHFRSVRDVKRYIDLIALYKLNRLHLHLSDDQGWRIAIAKWPRLATHGGQTAVGGGKGGYYTQAQYSRHRRATPPRGTSTIVPEIDMPGHIHAALSSYPKLACDGKPSPLYTGIDVGFSSLCIRQGARRTTSSPTWSASSRALTPGPYIHIGGDEATATKPADYVQLHRPRAGDRRVARQAHDRLGGDRRARSSTPATVVAALEPDPRSGALSAPAVAAGREGDHVAGRARLPRHEVRRVHAARAALGRVHERAGRVRVGSGARGRRASGAATCSASRRRCGAETVADDGGRRVPGVPAADRDRRDRLVARARRASWAEYRLRLGAQGPLLARARA